MQRLALMLVVLLLVGAGVVNAQEKFDSEVIKTGAGDLKITFIGHGTLMFTFGGQVIHVDPVAQYADYGKLPQGGPDSHHPRAPGPPGPQGGGDAA